MFPLYLFFNILFIKETASAIYLQPYVQLNVWRPVRNCLPLEMVRAGDHCDRRMSRQMLPLLLIFGW